MALRDKAAPYAERLLEDRELQNDLREAMSALRSSINRVESKRRKPSRLLGDKKLGRSARQAKASFKDAHARFRGEPPKNHRGRKIVIALVVVGVAAFAAKEMLKGEEAPPAPIA